MDNEAIKENVSIIAKMLSYVFTVFGYEVTNQGLLLLLRTFNNDVVEGSTTEWCTENNVYDAEDFGYYDGIENERIFDEFYTTYSIADLLK